MTGAARLRRQLESVRTLGSVVGTMKALASVRIGQYRRAARSLANAAGTLELGFQALLREHPDLAEQVEAAGRSREPDRLGAIVLGSDQGLCGGFNERIVRFAAQQLAALSAGDDPPFLLAAGWRAQRRLEGLGLPVARRVAMPGGAAGIGAAVDEVLLALDGWREERGIGEVLLFHNTPVSDAGYRQRGQLLLPLDLRWLAELRARPWSTAVLPMTLGEPQTLFRGLLRQQLYVTLFGAFAESLASENAARLAAMQVAERSIEARLEELEVRYRRARALAVTEELLDIQAGFAMLEGGR